jgi:hypothetical protein
MTGQHREECDHDQLEPLHRLLQAPDRHAAKPIWANRSGRKRSGG